MLISFKIYRGSPQEWQWLVSNRNAVTMQADWLIVVENHGSNWSVQGMQTVLCGPLSHFSCDGEARWHCGLLKVCQAEETGVRCCLG